MIVTAAVLSFNSITAPFPLFRIIPVTFEFELDNVPVLPRLKRGAPVTMYVREELLTEMLIYERVSVPVEVILTREHPLPSFLPMVMLKLLNSSVPVDIVNTLAELVKEDVIERTPTLVSSSAV